MYVCVNTVFAQILPSEGSVCQVNESRIVEVSQELSISVVRGSNTLYFDCNIQKTSILTLPAIGVHSVIVQTNGIPTPSSIPSNKSSYVLLPGEQRVSIALIAERARNIEIQLSSLRTFHSVSMSHNTVMSLYIGLCLSLALFVGLLGRGIKNTGFYAYSVYLVSLAMFFGVQEGIFNYYFDNLRLLNAIATQSFIAGIVVFFATQFVSRLLDFKLLLNNSLYKIIMGVAIGILLSGISIPIMPQSLSGFVGLTMGWATLLLVFAIFCIAGYAAIHRVHTASIVVFALSIVLFGMIFRIWLTDLSEFLNRYALIIATAIESFIFAFAASEKVRYLDKEKSKAYHSATQDDLCPVMNRRGWMLAVKRKIEYYKKRNGFVVLQFVDLDDFKSINDSFGHHVGDSVLQTVAKIIRHQAREDDVVGRFGGDEFVIFSHALSGSQAQRMSQRLSNKLSNIQLSIDGKAIKLSASVGTISVASESAKLETMLEQADRQMYNQKQLLYSA